MSNTHDDDRVSPGCACPACGEDRMDLLVWTEDETVRCAACGTEYRFDAPADPGPADEPYLADGA